MVTHYMFLSVSALRWLKTMRLAQIEEHMTSTAVVRYLLLLLLQSLMVKAVVTHVAATVMAIRVL